MASSAGKLRNTTVMFVLPLAIAILAAGYLYARYNQPVPDVREFSGNASAVEGNVIRMIGAYVTQGTLPPSLRGEQGISFRVTEATVFEKITMKLPNEKDVAANGGRFDLEDLATTTSPGSLAELASVVKDGTRLMEAEFASQIIGAKDPVATRVTYRMLSYSDRLTLPPPPKQK
jgi:hypothetical protein